MNEDPVVAESDVNKRLAGINILVRPRSIAIIGMSSKSGTPSWAVLKNLLANGYSGDIHLVGRSGGVIDGRQCHRTVGDLPTGVDLAILTVGSAAVRETIEACVARKIKSAVCFASGFAEMGEEGRRDQQEVGRIARAGGLALVGPNCVGYFNYVDSFAVMLIETGRIPQWAPESGRGVAIVAQSGGIGAHLAASLGARKVPVSYMMTTGNEADIGLADLIEFFARDCHTDVILIYAEQIRRPWDLLAAARTARARGTRIAMFHPGRSIKAQAAANSHTGALAGDYLVMRTVVEQSGIAVVETLEDLIDLGQLLLRFPAGAANGLGVLTASGAICAIVQDYAESQGLDVPPLSIEQVEALRPHLPNYTPPRNPLDLGTVIAWQPDLVGRGLASLLADEAIGIVLIIVPYAEEPLALAWINAVVGVTSKQSQPFIYVIHNEGVPLHPAVEAVVTASRMVVMRSPGRAMRAVKLLTAYGHAQQMVDRRACAGPEIQLPSLAVGPQAEWRGKQVLRAIGIPIPPGDLATTPNEAIEIARRIGFPVVLKAQAATLAHKSEVGGVLLNIADEEMLRESWRQLQGNVAEAKPGLTLDGALVEKMGRRGLELVVGARRDPLWGPIILLGMGGIWIEALADCRLLPANASEILIVETIYELKSAKLLRPFRGAKAVDVAAVARAAAAIGRLMELEPRIVEVDVNPLVAFAAGEGVMALDALIITR